MENSPIGRKSQSGVSSYLSTTLDYWDRLGEISSSKAFTDQSLRVKVDDMRVGVVSVGTKSLHHERRGRLHAVKQTGVHNARHLRLQNVLCALDLLVREVAECCKVVTAHGLRNADGRVAETVADGNVRLLVACIKNLLGRNAVNDSVQMSCKHTYNHKLLSLTTYWQALLDSRYCQ